MAAPRATHGRTTTNLSTSLSLKLDCVGGCRSIYLGAQGLAVLALVGSLACARPVLRTVPHTPALLAVVTWNMNDGRGDVARLVSDLERGLIGIPPARAYLLLLQEAAADELEAIAVSRRWTTCFVPVRGTDERVRGNAIVFSGVVRNPRAIPLPRERQPRAAAAVSIDVAGVELFVVSVHLENRASWWKGGLFGDTSRRHQVDALMRVLPADAHGILGGDFNTWLGPNEPAWRTLARRFADTPEWPRSPTFGDRLVLDHVLMDVPDGWRTVRRVLHDDYGSDHHPVIALVLGSG